MFAFSNRNLQRLPGLCKKLNAQGITSVCDMSTMAGSGPDLVREDIYLRLQQAGQLTVRVHMFPTLLDDLSRPQWMRRTFTGETLRFCGVKQFSDGVSSTHTAYLKEPYSNACFPGDRGCTVTARNAAPAGAQGGPAGLPGAHPHHRRRGHPPGAGLL